jgi:hypothetical protein
LVYRVSHWRSDDLVGSMSSFFQGQWCRAVSSILLTFLTRTIVLHLAVAMITRLKETGSVTDFALYH